MGDEEAAPATIKSLPTLHQLILKQDAKGVQALLGRLPPSSLPLVMAETIPGTGATPLHVCAILPAAPSSASSSSTPRSIQPTGGDLGSMPSQQRPPQPRDLIADLLLTITFQSRTLDHILLAAGPVGETALHIAARSGFDGFIGKVFEHLFKLLRQASSSPSSAPSSSPLVDWDGFVNGENAKGRTALHVAAKSGQYDCCMTLVANGAAVDWEDADHRTAYDLALLQQHDEVPTAHTPTAHPMR
jgi:ankyrin repeat protein